MCYFVIAHVIDHIFLSKEDTQKSQNLSLISSVVGLPNHACIEMSKTLPVFSMKAGFFCEWVSQKFQKFQDALPPKRREAKLIT